jgi:phosphate-selective porin OprO and OprP
MNSSSPAKRMLALSISSILITSSPFAYADDGDSAELAALKAQLEELNQRILVLDRKLEIAAEETAAKQKTTPVVVAGDKGFALKSADSQFEFKLRGLLQTDYRSFSGDAFPTATDGFLIRRARPIFEGTLLGKYGFRFMPDFGDNKSTIVDAYIDAKFDPKYQVRVGKFKPFVGLERLQSATDIRFAERSYVSNNILPNRDLGISLFGETEAKTFSYAVGIFNGATDGSEITTSLDSNSGKDFDGRLFFTPWASSDSALKGLGFGIGGTYGDVDGTTSNTGLPSYKSAGQSNVFFSYAAGNSLATTAIADGNRLRWSPQAYFYRGPFGFIGEYAQVRQDVKLGVREERLDSDAWQLAGTWILTGEDASFKGVKPFNPIGSEGGWGAFELGLRFHENNLDQDAASFRSLTKPYALSAKTYSIGLNWYLNEFNKLVFNYEKTEFDDGSLDGDSEDFLVARYQLGF